MENTPKIIIYTNTYSRKSYDIFRRLHNLMIDANVMSKVREGFKARQFYDFIYSYVDTQTYGEVIWVIETSSQKVVNDYIRNVIKDRDKCHISSAALFSGTSYQSHVEEQQEIYNQLLDLFKNTVIGLLDNKEDWRHDCNTILDAFSGKYIDNNNGLTCDNVCGEDITVSDICCLYDVLSKVDRKTLQKLYSEEQLNSIIGVTKDPVAHEFEIIKREKFSEIYTEYNSKTADLIRHYNYDIDLIRYTTKDRKNSYVHNIELDNLKVYNNIHKKFNEDMNKIQKEYEQKCIQLNKLTYV